MIVYNYWTILMLVKKCSYRIISKQLPFWKANSTHGESLQNTPLGAKSVYALAGRSKNVKWSRLIRPLDAAIFSPVHSGLPARTCVGLWEHERTTCRQRPFGGWSAPQPVFSNKGKLASGRRGAFPKWWNPLWNAWVSSFLEQQSSRRPFVLNACLAPNCTILAVAKGPCSFV